MSQLVDAGATMLARIRTAFVDIHGTPWTIVTVLTYAVEPASKRKFNSMIFKGLTRTLIVINAVKMATRQLKTVFIQSLRANSFFYPDFFFIANYVRCSQLSIP
jgi:hypothetical protein